MQDVLIKNASLDVEFSRKPCALPPAFLGKCSCFHDNELFFRWVDGYRPVGNAARRKGTRQALRKKLKAVDSFACLFSTYTVN
jgi:hypothetical protein